MATARKNHYRKPPLLRAGTVLFAVLVAAVVFCVLSFGGTFARTVPITVISDRSGLVMEPGAKVKVNGVEVGRVRDIAQADGRSELHLDIESRRFGLLTADTTAEIKATTAFGSKYVALHTSTSSASRPLVAGAQVTSSNVTTEVNTVFENLAGVMRHVDPAELNAALGAVAEGMRGRGKELGTTAAEADSALTRLNPAMPGLQRDLRDAAAVSQTYADVAPQLLDLLRYATTTADSVVAREAEVIEFLQAAVVFGESGAGLVNSVENDLISAMRLMVPTAGLLAKYSPELTCLMQQTVDTNEILEHSFGGNNGYSLDLDVGLLAGDDSYKYPQNLPEVRASGGPGGEPGCNPLITRDMYPSPVLVTDTGASITGATSPRLANPLFVDYLFGNIVGGPFPR